MARDLVARCSRCAGLCCAALAFDRGALFAHDKAADEPCHHLGANGCAIHRARGERGYAGCVGYDCHGAGQRVTEELFGGASWRERPELGPAMFAAFRELAEAHRLLALLDAAARLPLDEARAAERARLVARLEDDETREVDARAAREVEAFLKSLRPLLRRPVRLRILSERACGARA